jgi:hypothetical protein
MFLDIRSWFAWSRKVLVEKVEEEQEELGSG